MNFCTNFNNITKIFPETLPLKISIKLFTDKTIQFQIKTPPVSFLLYSSYLNNNLIGVKLIDLFKIIFIKKIDSLDLTNNALMSSIVGTARSMKIRIIN